MTLGQNKLSRAQALRAQARAPVTAAPDPPRGREASSLDGRAGAVRQGSRPLTAWLRREGPSALWFLFLFPPRVGRVVGSTGRPNPALLRRPRARRSGPPGSPAHGLPARCPQTPAPQVGRGHARESVGRHRGGRGGETDGRPPRPRGRGLALQVTGSRLPGFCGARAWGGMACGGGKS